MKLEARTQGCARPAVADELLFERRAVAFADVVGFSALMGRDERAAFQRWNRLKSEIILPAMRRAGGIYVKSTGDGLLATFETPDFAIEWSAEVQRGARQYGEGLQFRIALNWGDVIVHDDDISGDCVNIAARLEKFAAPGGVVMTDVFRDGLSAPEALDLKALGRLELRNINRRVVAFQFFSDARATHSEVRSATRLPSVAVLPFEADESSQILAKGLFNEIIVSLAGMNELTVISRSSALAVGANGGADAREAGRALDVAYVLSGVVEGAGPLKRATLELMETESGVRLLTESVSLSENDIFGPHNEIVRLVASRIVPEVRQSELAHALSKPADNFSAYEHLLRALDLISGLDRAAFMEARSHLDLALADDPNYAMARAWSARWRTLAVGQGWSDEPTLEYEAAVADARAAIRTERRNSLALATFGHVHAYLSGDYDTAISYLDRAVGAGPNDAIARILRSGTLSFLGRATEAREEAAVALRLSPFDAHLFQFYGFMALACYVCDDFPEAIRWAHRSLAENPNYTHTLKVLVVSQAAAGDIGAASVSHVRLMRRDPRFDPKQYFTARRPFAERARIETLVKRFAAAAG